LRIHIPDGMSTEKQNQRSVRTKQAILDATRKLLAERGGVRSLTIEAVAARSGVAKTTIYRRWRDKWELALDAAMIDVLTTFDDPVDVGDTRSELITFVNAAVRTFGSKPYGPALQGLASEVATDPDLARVYREFVVDPRRRQLEAVIERGIERGDIRPDTEPRLIQELLIGPLYYRLLFSGPPFDESLGPRLVDAILEGFRARPAETGRRDDRPRP
jgi:AcrR family transcriptional regulator